MKRRSDNNEHSQTVFIWLDTKKCIACWMCQDKCPKHVIGKVNLPWHKHAHIVKASNCTGCNKCVNVCQSNALLKVATKVKADIV